MLKLLGLKQPVVLIVLTDIIAFILLYYYKKPADHYILLTGLLVISLIITTYFIIVKRRLGDEYLFLIVSMLVSMGFAMIYRLDKYMGSRQVVWFAAGIILFFLSYTFFLKIKILEKLMLYYIVVSVLLFGATLVLGQSIKGSTNWIFIGGYSFQPSEVIKIIFVFTLACFFKRSDQVIFGSIRLGFEKLGRLYRLAFMSVSFMFMGFLVLQREWGTTLLLFLIYISLLYVLDNNTVFFLINTAAAAAGGVAGALFVNHIKVRIDIWLNPWADIAGKGYQVTQSLFAMGSGGFFGTGIGMGRPDLIPEAGTDFIFAAICEEMGIFGGAAVVLLYFILTYRGIKIALSVKDVFIKTVALGLTCMFGFQTFIIIGGVIKLIPLTGITLPFISYGGSSLTTSFIALGILQAISQISSEGERSEEIAGE